MHDIDLEGLAVPGLTGEFFEREEGGRTATAGRYSLRGHELFLAWGYRDEAHCAWTAYRHGAGWTTPHRGCPRQREVDKAIARPGAQSARTGSGEPGCA